MQLVLTAALCCCVFSTPLPVPLEEEFNMSGFSEQENQEEIFLRVDQNKDKKLDFDEFLHTELAYVDAKKEEFDSLDKDGDGMITKKEYEEHYDGIKSRSIARRTEYFANLFQEFDEDFDMSLNQDELKNLLAKRFFVKPRENFSKLFNIFDKDRSGGLDLFEYMKFDEDFPFDQTDPIIFDVNPLNSSGGEVSLKQGVHVKTLSGTNFDVDEQDADAIAQVMSQASSTFKNYAPKKITVSQKHVSSSSSEHGFTASAGFSIHPVKPTPSRPFEPIRKIIKVVESI